MIDLLVNSLVWISACFFIFQMLRPQKPELFILNPSSLAYDEGTKPPYELMWSVRNQIRYPYTFWITPLKKRFTIEGIKKDELKFVYEKNPTRIYFDKDLKRIKVGTCLSEP